MKLTKAKAKALADNFIGAIERVHKAHNEFSKESLVLVPTSNKDVIRALRLARAAGSKVSVRSGSRVSTENRDLAPPEDGASHVVVSLEEFAEVELDQAKAGVVAGAAATIGEIADAISGQNLFLPLGADPSRSLISSLYDPVPPLPRSASGLTLRGLLKKAQVIPVEGTGAGRQKNRPATDVAPFLDGSRVGLLTRIELDAKRHAGSESGRWLEVRYTQYTADAFRHLCDTLLAENHTVLPEVDIRVRVTAGAYGLTLVVVRATGSVPAQRDSTMTTLNAAMEQFTHVEVKSAEGPGSSMAAWSAAGPGLADPSEVHVPFGPSPARPFAEYGETLIAAIEAVRAYENLDAWVEVSLQSGADTSASAYLVDDGADQALLADARDRLSAAIPRAEDDEPGLRAALRSVDVLSDRPTVEGFRLQPMAESRLAALSDTIPDFNGRVLTKKKNRRYRKDVEGAYAYDSYDSPTHRARMAPRMVARPEDTDAVVLAVKFAVSRELAVVARSGGHQYCGLSSGGSDTMVLDMSKLDELEFSADGTRATVQPGVQLRHLSKALRRRRVVIPHGECPKVCLGGHAQTGGVGHQLRTLGLTLDHIVSFKMVVAGPGGGIDSVRERKFDRPTGPLNVQGDPVTDGDIFAAVLGGGPGSWGVVTEFTFQLVRDDEFADSQEFRLTDASYDRGRFTKAMNQLRHWAELQSEGNLPEGADFFLSAVSGDTRTLRPSVVVVEAMSTTRAGLQLLRKTATAIKPGETPRPRAMSVIADDGVRRIGTFGLPRTGREFNLPYKKSLYITDVPFTLAFVTGFVNLVSDVMDADGLKVVFQAAIGGGKFLANGKNSATFMQRRDALVQLVFDVFYGEGKSAAAVKFQARMRRLLNEYSDGRDLRMFWGTFEEEGTTNQLDMGRPEVRALYFDVGTASNGDPYPRLQEVKRSVDPENIFRTKFTVKA